jgi:hypothetical protein
LTTMKMFRNSLFMLALSGLLFMASCSDDDPTTTPDSPDGEITSQDDVDLVVSDLRGNVTGNITLAAGENWVLTGPLVVKAGATLTIAPGTTIKAKAGGTDVFIAIERNADIVAVGTAAAPITITSAAAAPEAGDWGGLMIMGNAKITGGGSAVTEVVDYIYGNGVDSNDADDSGDIKFLILKYTGARINGEKEFNGLTLYGVGSGTTISDVAIFNGDDDGIEWFGGTVSITNALVVNATDDMFDWTQGYSGTVTNAYGIREAGYDAISADPRGLEGDGNLDGLTPASTPQSNATFTNLTLVNKSTVAVWSDVVKIRRNSKATITNALVTWAATALAPDDFVDCTDGLGSASASTTVTISGTGANLNTADNKAGDNVATITVAATTGVANPSTLFQWTGYTGF